MQKRLSVLFGSLSLERAKEFMLYVVANASCATIDTKGTIDRHMHAKHCAMFVSSSPGTARVQNWVVRATDSALHRR